MQFDYPFESVIFFLINIGGYRERPELLEDEAVRLLKSFAAGYLSPTQNLLLKLHRFIRVQTQVVNDMNYKIDFVVEPAENVSSRTTTCLVLQIEADQERKYFLLVKRNENNYIQVH